MTEAWWGSTEPFRIVCTGGSSSPHHEHTLAKWDVRPDGSLLAASPTPVDVLREHPSYRIAYDEAGDVIARRFHCRDCGLLLPMTEADFMALIRWVMSQRPLEGCRVDLSTGVPGTVIN